MSYFSLGVFQLSLFLFDSLDERLSHFLLSSLQLAQKLLPLRLVRLLKTDVEKQL